MPIDIYGAGTGGGGGGSGDVTGPASSTDNAITRFSGATGKIVQNSSATIDDSGQMSLVDLPDVNKNMMRSLSTGLITGGEVSINTNPTLFDVAAGSGIIVDNWTDPENPTFTTVTWSAFTGVTPTFIATQGTSFLFINSSGAIEQSTSFPNDGDLRDKIQIGSIVHPDNVNITGTSQFLQAPIQNMAQTMTDFTIAIGVINESGNVFSGGSGTLQIEKSSGVSMYAGINSRNNLKDPNRKQVPAKLLTDNFIVSWRDGVGGYNTKLSTLIEPGFYDDDSGGASNPGGTVATNNWQIMYIQYSPDAELGLVQWGQTEYNTQNQALNAISRGTDNFTANPAFSGVPLRAYLIVRGGATDLSSTGDATFVDAGKFGAAVGQASTSDAAVTLQGAYESSSNPEIITNATNGAVDYRQGSGADTDDVLTVANGAGTKTFAVTGAGDVTATSVDTGQGANELYAMNQAVQTTDAVTFATVNTGQGANELYAMNQAVQTTDNVTFNNISPTGTVDGRDVATDGTKLDGIEANADVTDEANVTDALDGATLAAATIATNDKVLIQDTNDSDILKTVTTQSIADLAPQGDVTASSTTTFTNKTFDANGTGNSISNIDVADLANGTDGELITWDATGAPATVAVGTSGQVLTSNGVGAAPTFQDAAGGGGGVVDFIGTFTVSSGNISITGLDFTTYNKYVITVDGISVSGGTNPQINARPNNDTSSVYDFGNFQNLNGVLSSEASTSTTFWRVIRNVANLSSASEASIVMTVVGDNQTANEYCAHWSTFSNDPDVYNAVGAGNWNDSAAMTSLTFTNLGSGTISTGTAKVYGFKE